MGFTFIISSYIQNIISLNTHPIFEGFHTIGQSNFIRFHWVQGILFFWERVIDTRKWKKKTWKDNHSSVTPRKFFLILIFTLIFQIRKLRLAEVKWYALIANSRFRFCQTLLPSGHIASCSYGVPSVVRIAVLAHWLVKRHSFVRLV